MVVKASHTPAFGRTPMPRGGHGLWGLVDVLLILHPGEEVWEVKACPSE